MQSQVKVQQRSGEGFGGGFGAARSGSTGFRRWFQRLASQHASERFVKRKKLRLLGIPPKLIAFPCFSATTPRALYMFTKRLTPE